MKLISSMKGSASSSAFSPTTPDRLELDLSSPEEVTDILMGDSDDEEDEWEDDSDDDICQVLISLLRIDQQFTI